MLTVIGFSLLGYLTVGLAWSCWKFPVLYDIGACCTDSLLNNGLDKDACLRADKDRFKEKFTKLGSLRKWFKLHVLVICAIAALHYRIVRDRA